MKHHIFVASTLDDLKNERKEIIRIIMEMGHIPVTVDFLDEKAKNAAKLTQKIIEECDYFILLTAYKFCPTTEYSIASQKGIPVLALIIDEKARWKSAKKDNDPELIKKLDDFKEKLKQGSFQTWIHTVDLCQKAQSLLIEELIINTRPGWIKTNNTLDINTANELSRLSSENSVLRRQFCCYGPEATSKLRDEQKRILKLLALNRVSLSFYYASGENWENTRQFREIRIFKLLVPELSTGKSTAEISRFLGTVLNPDLDKTIRNDYPTPSNTIKKIMADFSILNLVKRINGKEDKQDEKQEEVWEITEYGRELFSKYRLRQLEKALVKKTEEPNEESPASV